MLFRDFTSSRGFRFLGSTRHNTQNKTLELISETPSFTAKLHSVCAVWTKRKVHWHEGFEIKLVFRMRNPDTTNNGGEGFALVLQQDRPLAVGDLRSKGERPPINGKTYFPTSLGFNELRKSWAIKIDMNPGTTDATRRPHISVHSGGDTINPTPSNAFTDRIPTVNNNHNHTLKIYYDLEPNGGVLRMYWASDHHGKYTWGTWNKPILQIPMTMPHLDKRPAWLGFTSATGFDKVQTVDIVAFSFHEIRHINGNQDKCVVCGGVNPRCCQHWEQMKEEFDSNIPSSTVKEYVGQDYPSTNENPRLWDKETMY